MPCVVTFIITFTTAATYASLTNAVFSALGSGTFLYLSLGHLIPVSLDNNDYKLYLHAYQHQRLIVDYHALIGLS